jgi:hypothetical protein
MKAEFVLVLILFVFILMGCIGQQQKAQDVVRKPAVAGTFYPSSSDNLTKAVDYLLDNAPELEINGSIVGLIAPHAGYAYSGQVAAYSFKQIKGRNFSTVIIIGPSHHYNFNGASLGNFTYFETPLGKVKVSNMTNELRAENVFVSFPEAQEPEHSVEVEVPFLQRVLDSFEIVPIVTGSVDPETLANAIINHLDEHTLIVASSDLSHYHPYNEAVSLDKNCLDAFSTLNVTMMNECELCGQIPVLTLMRIANKLGLQSQVLAYMNSGDVTGDASSVVGYSSVVFYRPELNSERKKILLEESRSTFEAYVRNGTILKFETNDSTLLGNRGTFVTLTKNGQLRGCIGHILPVEPLYLDVQENTINAAVNDPRFVPVTADELDSIKIEISALTYPMLARDTNEIEVGRHGLIMSRGGNQGVLLPQVPLEYGWDKTTFLEQTCNKAGMEKNCWKDTSTKIYKFSADVFNESEFGLR